MSPCHLSGPLGADLPLAAWPPGAGRPARAVPPLGLATGRQETKGMHPKKLICSAERHSPGYTVGRKVDAAAGVAAPLPTITIAQGPA